MNKDFEALKNIKKIHMIGIGGVSMSGIALILKKDGYEVTGSDRNYGDMIETLEQNGIPVFIGSNVGSIIYMFSLSFISTNVLFSLLYL